MDDWGCEFCGSVNSGDRRDCFNCGQAPGEQERPSPPAPPAPLGDWPAPPRPPTPPVMPRICFACGATIDPRAEICPKCGVRQQLAAGPGPGKDRAVAALFALLLGNVGIHKFYLGNVALGIVYILFSWTGIPSLIAWVEAITYLVRSDESWAAEYGGPVRRPNSAGIGCLWVLTLWPLVVLALVVSLIFLGGQVQQITSRAGADLPDATLQASPSGPTVDTGKIASLMAKLQANPKDTATLKALGDEYFNGQQFDEAATFYDQLLAIDPNNVDALIGRGATYYNLGDDANAEKLWKQVVALNPTDKAQAQEVHYDLGFLYLNSTTPDWAKVESEWKTVIAIDSTTQLARLVQQHLDSLVAASMIPPWTANP